MGRRLLQYNVLKWCSLLLKPCSAGNTWEPSTIAGCLRSRLYTSVLKKFDQSSDYSNSCNQHTSKTQCELIPQNVKIALGCQLFIYQARLFLRQNFGLLFGHASRGKAFNKSVSVEGYSGHNPDITAQVAKTIPVATHQDSLLKHPVQNLNGRIKRRFGLDVNSLKETQSFTCTIHGSSLRFAAIICSMMLLLCVFSAASSQTVDPKSRNLLEFIGNIEGPAGYDDYYRGVSSGPPRAVSSMTIGEVLAWQDSIDASSRSEAAGRYQIMEDTLRGLVSSEGIDPNTRFDAATQDQLALTLLKRRGWDPTRTDYVKMGNAIAYEWAALPICSGVKKGRSAYDGLAGNSALTSCAAYMEMLSNGADPEALAWAMEQSSVGHAGTGGAGRVQNSLDKFIRAYKNTFYSIADNLVVIATSLLFGLLLIEWIWTTAQCVARGAGTAEYLRELGFRVVLGGAFLFIINIGNYSDLVIRSADGLLAQTSQSASINVIDLFDRVLATTFELWGRSTFNIVDKFVAFVVIILGTLIIGLIIISYMEVYLAFGAAVVALGFGGFSGTRFIAISYLKRAVGRLFRLFTALFCGALMSILLTSELESQSDAMLLTAMLLIIAIVIFKVPAAVEQTVIGSASLSTSERLISGISNKPIHLAQMAGRSAMRGGK